MGRVYNFSAGPAVLPEEVLREAADEMLDYRGCGMSVMEMSHRSKMFEEIIQTAEADLRDLMGIPENSTFTWDDASECDAGDNQFPPISQMCVSTLSMWRTATEISSGTASPVSDSSSWKRGYSAPSSRVSTNRSRSAGTG